MRNGILKVTQSEVMAVISRLAPGRKNLREVADELNISVDEASRAAQLWAYQEAGRFLNRI